MVKGTDETGMLGMLLTDTVAVFARPASTEVMVLLLTVRPLAIVVIIAEQVFFTFCMVLLLIDIEDSGEREFWLSGFAASVHPWQAET